jgi:hypothetical protein
MTSRDQIAASTASNTVSVATSSALVGDVQVVAVERREVEGEAAILQRSSSDPPAILQRRPSWWGSTTLAREHP